MIPHTTSYFLNSIYGSDSQARNTASEARIETADLHSRVDRLSLLSMALWTLARDKLGVTEDEMLKRIQELDLSDGKLDGRMNIGVSDCPNCKRPLSPRHTKCLYCGNVRATVTPP